MNDIEDLTGKPKLVFKAIARVDSDDATYVHEHAEGVITGISVECVIVHGPYVGAQVRAIFAPPVGGSFTAPVTTGDTVLLDLIDGTLDGPIFLTAAVPGGLEKPLPTVVAGVAMNEEGLAKVELHAPPPGVGVRWYLRGAPFVLRLKGKQADFVGELFIEFDDASFFRGSYDPTSGGIGFSMRDSKGCFMSMTGGAFQVVSPGKATLFEISDDGINMTSDKVICIAGGLVNINGGAVTINVPAPTPAPALVPFAALHGVSGVAAVPSTTVFIGA